MRDWNRPRCAACQLPLDRPRDGDEERARLLARIAGLEAELHHAQERLADGEVFGQVQRRRAQEAEAERLRAELAAAEVGRSQRVVIEDDGDH